MMTDVSLELLDKLVFFLTWNRQPQRQIIYCTPMQFQIWKDYFKTFESCVEKIKLFEYAPETDFIGLDYGGFKFQIVDISSLPNHKKSDSN